jgi:hypothetical protein
MSSLCFSASSHYPWVSDGLPAIVAHRGRHHVGRVGSDGSDAYESVDDAVDAIERMLTACPVRPFFGTRVDLDHATVGAALAALGSALRPTLRRSGPWSSIEIVHGDQSAALIDLTIRWSDGEKTRCADHVELARRLHERLGSP